MPLQVLASDFNLNAFLQRPPLIDHLIFPYSYAICFIAHIPIIKKKKKKQVWVFFCLFVFPMGLNLIREGTCPFIHQYIPKI
jgi:hypothetical protein